MKILAKASVKNTGDLKAVYDELRAKNILARDIDHFGRMNTVSRLTVCVFALALHQAGIKFTPEEKQNIGFVATDAQGSLQANELFFKDYLQGGRHLARANLFIYTLPTSPLAESAIVFNLYGPVIYFPNRKMKDLIKHAQLMVQSTLTKKVLVIRVNNKSAQATLIGEK